MKWTFAIIFWPQLKIKRSFAITVERDIIALVHRCCEFAVKFTKNIYKFHHSPLLFITIQILEVNLKFTTMNMRTLTQY